jgi:hypothetical protein
MSLNTTLDWAEILRSQRTLTQSQVDERASEHDIDNFTADERLAQFGE